MKNIICIIIAVFCFFMVPASIVGGIIITMSMPVMYKATATVRFNIMEELEHLSVESLFNDILKKDAIFQKAASEKKLQERCGTSYNKVGLHMSKPEVYHLLQKNVIS